MNLVKAQALANDLPITELKKYADGFDPRIIPPWVATGTLQAKMDLNKRMQNMIGGSQGAQPSVKEQIEQKAGLMAANTMQQQQQQAQQQMAMANRPGPAPAGVPQPEDQPEAPVQMARGGLTSVPVQFAFKPGGIVGYSKGGEVDAAREEAKQAIANLRSYGTVKMRQDPEGFRAAEAAAAQARARLQAAEAAYAQEMGSSGANRAAMNIRDVGAIPELMQPEEPIAQRPSAPAMTAAQPATQTYVRGVAAPKEERPAPRPDVPRPVAQPTQTAQAPQAGLAAAANRSPYFLQADAALNAPNVQPTPQSVIAEQTALSPQAMLEENMRKRYEERKARADQERAAFEKTRPSGLDDLIRVFGQAGQYKGMSGLAPAYTANQDRKRAEELALERRMNELYTAADTQEFTGAKELFESRTKSMDAANKSYQDRLKSRSETLAQLANVDQRRMDAELDRLTQTEIAKIRAADAGSGDMKYLAQYLGLKAAGQDKEAAVLLESFNLFKRGEPKPDPYKQELMKTIAEKEVALAAMPPSKLADDTRAQLAALKRQAGITGGGGSFTVTAGGKTYTFPTKEAADKFKAEAGVK